MSRILVWSPNYAPEPTGIPPLVTDASDWLAARGHEVTVVTAVPNYPERRVARGYRGLAGTTERRGDVRVHRSWLRVRPGESFADKLLYELSFATLSLPHALRELPRCEVVVCVVPSLIAAAYAAVLRRLLARRRLVLWVQDLVLLAAAVIDARPRRARQLLALAARAERLALGAADRVVVCSPGFRAYLIRLGADERRIETVYNWVDADWIAPLPPRARAEGESIRLLYAGNLGYTQGFETLVDAGRELDGEVEIEIVGDGNAAAHVRALARGTANVRVRPPVPRAEFPGLLASADAHVVLQRSVGAGANFPSKIASYLASGRPIIASMSQNSTAAETLRSSGAALLVPPEEPVALAEAMRRLRREPALREELGRRAREFALRTFERSAALTRLEATLLR